MNKELVAALEDLQKRFGDESIRVYGDERVSDVEVISTRCPSLDLALGVKGLPKGRMVEIYGAESSGKTTLALQVIAEAQSKGDACAFLDVEHALDPNYAKALGINMDELIVSQPDSAEQTLEIAEALIESGQVGVVVIDSVAAMVPQAEINGEFGDAQMGLMARLMSQAGRKLTAQVAKQNVCLIFINQTREKIGIMWGSPVTTTGGKALKFYASIRIEINRIGSVKQGEDIIGNRTKAKVVKNKLAPPFKEVEFDIMYGKGISKEGDLIDMALEKDIIEKKGSWFSYGETRLGQGKENVRQMLMDNPELALELEAKIYA